MAKAASDSWKFRVDDLEPWEIPSAEIDRILATRDDPRLRILFGDDYEELRELAKAGQRTARSLDKSVLFVPGILGSTLGKPGNFLTKDTIWFDPSSLIRGDVVKLKLGANDSTDLESLDVVPVVHAYLRLRLRMHGFNVEYFHYDWRQSLKTLGKRLADHVASLPGPVQIVAHSMGGLVARAALKVESKKSGPKKIKQVVMLGTPNHGAFSPVQVLQGINQSVVLVDKLDPFHTADELVRDVFSSFTSLYELMPRPTAFNAIDLFDPQAWPKNRFRPSAARLKKGLETWKDLVDFDPRLFLIAGVDRPTIVGLAKKSDDEFEYLRADAGGDGTVPLAMCLLDKVPTWYEDESHTGLLRNERVAKAVADLLEGGDTTRLENKYQVPSRRAEPSIVAHRDFLDDPARPRLLRSRSGNAIEPDDLPILAESVMSMSSLPAEQSLNVVHDRRDANRKPNLPAAAEPTDETSTAARLTSGISFNQTVISRDSQSHLELELFNGNIFDVPYRAVVLGVFSNVDPDGPSKTLDTLTYGAVTELKARRMFDASVGKVFVMPTGRNALKADYVVFAGLGEYDAFSANPGPVLQTISCNVLRTLMNCGVEEFATLIYGGASGYSVRGCVESLVRGYLDALKALGGNDRSIRFRRVALCERSPERFAELKDEVYRLGGTDLCSDVRLRLHEARYPASAAAVEQSMARATAKIQERRPKNIVYLTARIERTLKNSTSQETDLWTVHAAMLGTGSKATIFPSVKQISRTKLDAILDRLPDARRTVAMNELLTIGKDVRDLIFTEDFIQVVRHDLTSDDHLAVILDESSTRIPWESLPLLEQAGSKKLTPELLPCLNGGVSRRFQSTASNSLAKYLDERRRDQILNVLLIINPTEDLAGAALEGKTLEGVLRELDLVKVSKLVGKQATRAKILQELGSGHFDVVHYAGHAFFDPINRAGSGLYCARGSSLGGSSILTGQDIASLAHLPSLVFFNACESARVRSQPLPDGDINRTKAVDRKKLATKGDRSDQDAGICEAVLRGGVSQLIGTYWPVNDSAAERFSRPFYEGLLRGRTVREAVLAGRAEVEKLKHPDLANYIHFGDPTFVVKER